MVAERGSPSASVKPKFDSLFSPISGRDGQFWRIPRSEFARKPADERYCSNVNSIQSPRVLRNSSEIAS